MPDDAPVLAKFASAFVMSIRFWLTLGALDKVVIKFFIATSILGILSIAFFELVYPNLDIDVIKSLKFLVSKLSDPILFNCLTKFCICAEIVGRFFVALFELLLPSFEILEISIDRLSTLNVSEPISFICLTN